MSYIFLPPVSSMFWGDPVATFGALPSSGNPTGIVRLVLSTGVPYYWTGAAWAAVPVAALVPGDVANTNSINLSVSGVGVLTANLNLSVAAADANFLKATYSIKSDGLFIELPFGTAGQTGVI